MKKNFLTLTICLLFGMTMQAQTWTRTLGTTNNDNELGLVYAAGTSYMFNVSQVRLSGQSHLVLSKLDYSGNLIWTYNYSKTSSNVMANDIIVDRDSNVENVGNFTH